MAAPIEPTNPANTGNDSDNSEVRDLDDKAILMKILRNQKSADKKAEKRFAKLDQTVSDTKKSLDTYIEDNNKAINKIQTEVKSAVSDIEKLKKDVLNLEEDITKAKQITRRVTVWNLTYCALALQQNRVALYCVSDELTLI